VASVTQNRSSAKTAAKVEGTTIAQVTATIGKADITASLIETMDADGNAVREIVMDFPDDYQLPEGYKYSVTVRIEPTAKAYQTFIDNGYTYTNKGDPDTDAKGNNTSSGKEGFYSNTKATVSYLFGGVKQPLEDYSKPVIQLDTVYVWDFSKISTSRGTGNSVLGLAGAAFTLTDSDNNIKYYGTSTNGGAVQWYKDADMTQSPVSYLDPGTYTLKETQAPTGYTCSDLTWKVTIAKTNEITIQSGENVVSANPTLPTEGQEGITIVGTNTQATDGKPAIVSYAIYFEDNILYELPSAGGTGIFLYLIAGILLMMCGALLIFVKRRKVLRI
jgi:LPXTG-motif cell wall-anchored protein